MREEPTENVLKRIFEANSKEQINNLLKDENITTDRTFPDFFNEYLSNNMNLSLPEIIQDSCLSRTYAYQIINGTRSNISREYVLALCYAARMNSDEVNHALVFSGNQQLYAKNRRDALLIFMFKQNRKDKQSTITELNITLSESGFAPIKTSKGRD